MTAHCVVTTRMFTCLVIFRVTEISVVTEKVNSDVGRIESMVATMVVMMRGCRL
jgi:hypothetical protein